MDEPSKILRALLDPNEDKRVSAVSDLVYSVENVNRVIALTLKGLTQLPTIKDDPEVLRELYAASSTVDNITTQLEAHWFTLHLHLERNKKQDEPQPAAVTIH